MAGPGHTSCATAPTVSTGPWRWRTCSTTSLRISGPMSSAGWGVSTTRNPITGAAASPGPALCAPGTQHSCSSRRGCSRRASWQPSSSFERVFDLSTGVYDPVRSLSRSRPLTPHFAHGMRAAQRLCTLFPPPDGMLQENARQQ
jgi:hypothetical protein